VATLRLALKTFLRLFAPFLPYITEEIWSWGLAEGEASPSIHKASWPGSGDFTGLAAECGDAVFGGAVAFLEAVRRAKSAAGATVGRHVSRLRVACNERSSDLLGRALDDAMAAARVQDHAFETREGMEDGTFEVLELKLADFRPGD
jgi:valyl-tRNA synthetase